MSVDCSIDSLDGPLKRPMFESTVIGDVGSSRLLLEPHPPCGGSSGLQDMVNRGGWQGVHYGSVGDMPVMKLSPKLPIRHVAMDTTQLEPRPHMHHDKPGIAPKPDCYSLLEPDVKLKPQGTHEQYEHCNSVGVNSAVAKFARLSLTHHPDKSLDPNHSMQASLHPIVSSHVPDTDSGASMSTITPLESSNTSELSDSDAFFEQVPHASNSKRGGGKPVEGIVPRQSLSHALSSAHIQQQLLLKEVNHGRTEPSSECSENSQLESSGSRYTRKVARLSSNPLSASNLHSDSDFANSVSILKPLHHTTMPSPVVKTRIDPPTQQDQSALHIRASSVSHDLSALRIRESSMPRHEKQDDEVLSPWEKWMIKKTKEDLEKRERKRREMQSQKTREEEAKDKAVRQMEKAAEVHKKWVEQKRAESQARRELEHKQRVTRKHEEEQKRQAIQAKAEECYQKWYNEREEQRKQLQLKEKREAEEKAEREQVLKGQAEHAYKVWLKTLGCKKTYGELINWSSSLGQEHTRWNY